MTRQTLMNLAVAVAVTGLPFSSPALAQDRTSNGNTTGSAVPRGDGGGSAVPSGSSSGGSSGSAGSSSTGDAGSSGGSMSGGGAGWTAPASGASNAAAPWSSPT